jgi:hypothetical protein
LSSAPGVAATGAPGVAAVVGAAVTLAPGVGVVEATGVSSPPPQPLRPIASRPASSIVDGVFMTTGPKGSDLRIALILFAGAVMEMAVNDEPQYAQKRG